MGTVAFRPAMAGIAILLVTSAAAWGDEGGVSVWLPGEYGSLAALPGTPGWSFSTLYYHTSADVGGNVAFPQGGELRAGVDARGDLIAAGVAYTFAEPVLDGQLTLSLLGLGGHIKGSVEATLTGPGGAVISGERTDTLTSYGDLFPQASLKWNDGTSNYMVYAMGLLPVGDYDKNRLANTGLGHGAIDGGAGYTYFNPESGNELSVVTGFTYNFENEHTDYQNGIDWHVDFGASHFFTPQVHAGVVGYFYQQVTGDSGEGAVLGDFKSRVAGVGPQIGFLFPAGDMEGYLNLKGYYEFAAENRAEGFNVWVTLAFSPAAHHEASTE